MLLQAPSLGYNQQATRWAEPIPRLCSHIFIARVCLQGTRTHGTDMASHCFSVLHTWYMLSLHPRRLRMCSNRMSVVIGVSDKPFHHMLAASLWCGYTGTSWLVSRIGLISFQPTIKLQSWYKVPCYGVFAFQLWVKHKPTSTLLLERSQKESLPVMTPMLLGDGWALPLALACRKRRQSPALTSCSSEEVGDSAVPRVFGNPGFGN